MGKRFTDTEKWKDEWYLSLDNDTRIVWQYILDNCTNAGRFKKNFKLLNFCCNVKHDEESFVKIFNGRTIDCGSFYFIPKFLQYQYPKGLNSYKPAILSIKDEVFQYNLIGMINERLGNDYLIIKETDTDKDIGIEKEKETDIVIEVSPEERKIIVDTYGVAVAKEYVERLKDYAGQFPAKVKKYHSHYATIRNWIRRDSVKKLPPKQIDKPVDEGARYDPNVAKMVNDTVNNIGGAK